jgi:hypothetical protein
LRVAIKHFLKRDITNDPKVDIQLIIKIIPKQTEKDGEK